MRNDCVRLLVVIGLATGSLFAQDASKLRIGTPIVLGDMNNFSAKLPFTRWRAGHLLAWDKGREPVGKIAVYDSNMVLERTSSLSIENAIAVSIVSVDMTSSGDLVASGVATQKDGAKARFLALISSNGSQTRIVRTEPYLPQYICAADGAVWTVGEEWLGPGIVRESGYSVLRQYSFEKGLLRSMVAREQLRGERVSFGGPVHGAILQCDGGLVRFYSGVTQQWFQYDMRTEVLTRDDFEPFPNSITEVTGMVVTPSGRVLASIVDAQSTAQSRVFELGAQGQNRPKRWIPVEGTSCEGGKGCIAEIMGIEGGDLVFVRAEPGGEKLYQSALANQ